MSTITTIRQIEDLETTPQTHEIPYTPWALNANQNAKYDMAMTMKPTREAEEYLLMLVAHRLRFIPVLIRDGKGKVKGERRATWQEAVQFEREALAWYALAHDVSFKPGCKIGVFPCLQNVALVFSAFLPPEIGVGPRKDGKAPEMSAAAAASHRDIIRSKELRKEAHLRERELAAPQGRLF